MHTSVYSSLLAKQIGATHAVGRHAPPWAFLIVLLTLLFGMQLPVKGQTYQADSLLLVLNKASGGKKVQTLLSLADIWKTDSSALSVKYAEQALTLAGTMADQKGIIEANYRLGAAYEARQKPESALEHLQRGLQLALEADEPLQIAEGYLYLAQHYKQANDLRTSIQQLTQCLELTTAHQLHKQSARCYTLLGANYHSLSLYETALAYHFKALAIHEHLQDVPGIASDYSSIGRVYQYTKDYEDAQAYFTKAISLFTTLKDEQGRMASILNLGVIFQKNGSYDSALAYYRKALPIAKQLELKSDEAKLTGNIGSTLVQQGKVEEGLVYLEQALVLKERINNHRSILHTLNDIADAKLLLNDARGAKATAEKVVRLAREYEEGNQLRYGYLNLSKSYKKLKQYEQAHAYLEKYDAIKDSLFDIAKAQQINQLQIQYETEKKDQAIASLQREKEIEDFRQKGYFLVAVLLLLTGGLLYNSQRLKTKKHQQLLAKGKEVDRLKSSFFANISHEFRTPLTLILGPIDTLLSQTAEPQQRVQLGFMKESASRLLRLVNQILDLSKAESGHLTLNAHKVAILPILKGVTGSFSSLAEARNIRLQFTASLAEEHLYCEPSHVETILINLISNAFKFSAEGGEVKVTVRHVLSSNTSYGLGDLEICVEDTGSGISPEQVEHIFDRYYQAGHAAASFFGGTGIGLALTKELVQLHGGTIDVSSTLGVGTKVRVCLPFGKDHLKEVQGEEVASLPQQPLVLPTAPQVQEVAIKHAQGTEDTKELPILLLIEDNEDVRAYIRTILSADYTLIEAVHGGEGVRLALEYVPDLIISDVMMPVMNGYEVCRTLKQDQRTSHIPLILLTAKASLHSRIEGLETEADLYLSKPFVPQELRLCIQNLLQARRRIRERYQKQVMLQPKEIAVNSVDEQFLAKLMHVLEENYADESFTVDQLSKEMNMSRSQLHRKLEALTDESSSQFIRTFRLQRAMELLKKNHASISEIAYMVGFGSPSYFNRCFLKQYGITPSAVMGA